MSAYKDITTDNCTVATTLSFPNRVGLSNLPIGTANQVLCTNAIGTNAQYKSTILQTQIQAGLNNSVLTSLNGVPTWQVPTRFYNSLGLVPTGLKIFYDSAQTVAGTGVATFTFPASTFLTTIAAYATITSVEPANIQCYCCVTSLTTSAVSVTVYLPTALGVTIYTGTQKTISVMVLGS